MAGQDPNHSILYGIHMILNSQRVHVEINRTAGETRWKKQPYTIIMTCTATPILDLQRRFYTRAAWFCVNKQRQRIGETRRI